MNHISYSSHSFVSENGANYLQLPNHASFFAFLVGMSVCLLVVKILILLAKLLNLQESIPYFDVFVSYFVIILAIALVLLELES